VCSPLVEELCCQWEKSWRRGAKRWTRCNPRIDVPLWTYEDSHREMHEDSPSWVASHLTMAVFTRERLSAGCILYGGRWQVWQNTLVAGLLSVLVSRMAQCVHILRCWKNQQYKQSIAVHALKRVHYNTLFMLLWLSTAQDVGSHWAILETSTLNKVCIPASDVCHVCHHTGASPVASHIMMAVFTR
jgi:hypothetical protein